MKPLQQNCKNLGIAEYRAELKPEDKANIVQDYQEKGGVLFIGDGVNDSPALAQVISALQSEVGHLSPSIQQMLSWSTHIRVMF